ncbi:TPA: phosphoribosylformylglycinamidine cyclo-ligase [Corynebacterium striatum]|nr:phosphoribosylformylglycinamidine cyclo-ligase [Corynebacterium striatum]HAT1318628.1 phosphoribosylformylglycinamidine cyclo-ligase [Corynebacterium striatum]HAT1484702.1 phosphoribosylformylglycinamidine cyclo-ligase [Corynebacterium striatum]
MSENTYAAAGVSIEEGDRAVTLFAPHAKRASRPEVVGGLGGFAGLFKLGDYKEPVLAAGSDGVGTKLAVAQAMDKHDTIGIDLVAMCVDDLVVCGAEPLFLQDYIAVGKVVPEKVAEIVKGIAEGCVQAGAALLGGETAEHPGVMDPEEYDVSATAVGVVEADSILGPDKVRDGDVLIAMASSGLHSNGYSLARYVLLEQAGLPLDGHIEELGRTLGEELLEPTRIYAKDCLALTAECNVATFCHVTGGGLAGNLERVIPEGLTAEVNRSTWTPGQIFKTISSVGKVSLEEMEKTFNMGVGMIAVVSPEDREPAMAMMAARHVDAWELGTIRAAGEGEARVIMNGEHPNF